MSSACDWISHCPWHSFLICGQVVGWFIDSVSSCYHVEMSYQNTHCNNNAWKFPRKEKNYLQVAILLENKLEGAR